MSVPIIYVTEVPDLAGTQSVDGGVALLSDDLSALNYAILATVGGILTATITSGGSALTSGTYNNVAVHAAARPGTTLGYVNIGVSATGIVTVLGIQGPGYGFNINDVITLPNGTIGTASSVLTTITVNTVLPCTAPFRQNTKFVELACDTNGPAFITFDSTLVGMGLTNGILTTQQSTLTTVANRIAANERLNRRVTVNLQDLSGLQSNSASGATPATLQAIMGTAAA